MAFYKYLIKVKPFS